LLDFAEFCWVLFKNQDSAILLAGIFQKEFLNQIYQSDLEING